MAAPRVHVPEYDPLRRPTVPGGSSQYLTSAMLVFSSCVGSFLNLDNKGSLTLAMGKCLWFSVKIKVCQLSLSSP